MPLEQHASIAILGFAQTEVLLAVVEGDFDRPTPRKPTQDLLRFRHRLSAVENFAATTPAKMFDGHDFHFAIRSFEQTAALFGDADFVLAVVVQLQQHSPQAFRIEHLIGSRQPLAANARPPAPATLWRSPVVNPRVAADASGDGDVGWNLAQHGTRGVRRIAEKVQLLLAIMSMHQLEHFQHQAGLGAIGSPPLGRRLLVQIQPRQNRQREVSVRRPRAFDHHAQHNPAMSPTRHGKAATGQQRIAMHAGTEDFQAASVEQRIVAGEEDDGLRDELPNQIVDGQARSTAVESRPYRRYVRSGSRSFLGSYSDSPILGLHR